MINLFKINGFEFTADKRAYAKISGLEPTDVAVNLITVGGYKRVSGSTRDNRIIQITGAVSDVSFIKDIYKYIIVGNEYNIEIGTEDTDKTFYVDGIITDISVERYKLPVTYTIKITCDSSFLFGATQTYEATTEAITVNLEDDFEILQDEIKVYHTIAAGEESFTIDFFGTTTVNFGTGLDGQEIVLDLSNQTCTIGGLNKFYLVSNWADGSYSSSFSIPVNTKVEYKEKVLGVF